ncbi:MAG TPA: histidine phosphatase family protein [Candidatus Limnocylindrales bacterium]|jgi:broad specificity phosphatase PhoE
MSVSIVYETHSISTDNETGVATGWLPGKLSRAGRASAREMGLRRRADGIARIYVSDLQRARETVHIAFEGSEIAICVDARLRECNYGRLNGMPREILEQERASHVEDPWPEGESYLDVVTRTRSLLADIARENDGERVLLVAHSANRWALQYLLEGRDLHDLVRADFDWQPGWEFTLHSVA